MARGQDKTHLFDALFSTLLRVGRGWRTPLLAQIFLPGSISTQLVHSSARNPQERLYVSAKLLVELIDS